MDDLLAFLRARLDEDERLARAATPGPWVSQGSQIRQWLEDERRLVVGQHFNPDAGPVMELEDGHHIARQDPARTLRRIEGLRKILEVHKPGKTIGSGPYMTTSCEGCGFGGPCGDPWTEDINECPVLRGLAVEFADHPQYQASWRPA
jgi:hypothetical protein